MFSNLTDDPKDQYTIKGFLEWVEGYFHTFLNDHRAIIDDPRMARTHIYFKKKVPE